MPTITPEAVMFLALILAVCLPPCMALYLATAAVQRTKPSYPLLILSGVTIMAWVPLIIISPQVLIDTFYPAL